MFVWYVDREKDFMSRMLMWDVIKVPIPLNGPGRKERVPTS